MRDNVFNIGLFPGFTGKPDLMEQVFLKSTVEGIIMRTYGAGNAPDDSAFLRTIRGAVASGKLIVNVTQCAVGTVEMGLYEASSELLEAGVLSGLDMTPEAALTKLMWTLDTQFGDGRVSQMQISQRGEQTENLFDLRFGGIDSQSPKDKYTNAVSPDGRLDRARISRAMLRISGLGIQGANTNDLIRIRAYMNMPSASESTAVDEERCVAVIEFKYDATKPEQTRMKNITYKTQNVIGSGDVILTLVADRSNGDGSEYKQVDMYFKGLYIAVYAKA
jgi:L-asparaginase